MANHLVGSGLQDEKLSVVFKALSDPTRREMLRRLAHGPMSVGELAEPFKMAKPTVSKHVKVLERAQLVERHIDGRQHYCYLKAATLREATRWLRFYEQFWLEKFDALEAHLAESSTAPSGEAGIKGE